MTPNSISLNASAIARVLSISAIVLIVASSVGQLISFMTGHRSLHGLIPLFNLNEEGNIPTLFSTLILFISATFLSIIHIIKKQRNQPYALPWAVLSTGFMFMAYDEAAQIHERLDTPVHDLLSASKNSVSTLIGNQSIFHYGWVIPYIILLLALILYFFKFLLTLPEKTRKIFLIAAATFIGGAIGLELVGGYLAIHLGENHWAYAICTTIEESLEMAGVIIFIYSLMDYLASNYKEVQLRFD